jgi:menaquinone-specific isochorismate synthase
MTAGPFHRLNTSPATDDTARSLAAQFLDLATRVRSSTPPAANQVLRIEREVDPVDILLWLRGAPAGARRYFRDRSAKLEVAGVGVARRALFGTHEALRLAPQSSEGAREPIHFTAQPFDPARSRDVSWQAFESSACVLPMVEFRREGERHCIAANIVADGNHDVSRDETAKLLTRLAEPSSACVVEPALVRESDGDGEARWTRAVRAGLDEIRAGNLRKIVLARTRRYAASGPLDSVAVLARLASRELRGFRFLMEVGEGRAFLGVTPERLVSRSGRVARSEAVAGTRPRGVDAVADRLLGESLLASQKDRREHEFVVERVREALTSCSTSLRIDTEPRLLRLAYVQHLATRVQADLRAGTSDADLVRLLHPTPAVAGAPIGPAIEALRAFEPFDRGLYAGPVGVVSRDGAEIAVAIRSARIDGDALVAFAGAGIVEGSDPAEEWRETGHKLLAFERLAT